MRNQFRVSTFIIGAILALSGIVQIGLAQDTESKSPPNIVFLLTDDQATISMGCYGNPEVKTPNMDRLAAQGVTFDNHYVTTAICMASRANIMTGLYEYRTGCNFNYGRMKAEHWKNSYPILLRAAGYRTAIAGKFGFEVEGVSGKHGLPEKDFDLWGGGPGQTHFQTKRNPSMAKYAKEFPHASTSYGAFGRDFIEQSVAANKPFCLSISFKAPHRPVQPDPKFDHVYEGQTFTKPKNYGRDAGKHLAEQSRTGRQYPRFEEWGYSNKYDQVMAKYYQQVYGVDVAVGMILDALKDQGVSENTVVIFTSDNGFLCGSHGYGSKVVPYEESARVPLIISDPRLPKSHGKRSRSLTGNIDLAPTMLELAGVDLVEGADGVSLLPLLDDQSATVREQLSIMNCWGPRTTHSFGIITSKWKYLYWYSQENGMAATEEMFDMSGERQEMKNAAVDPNQLDELNAMRELYDQAVYAIKEKGVDQHRKFSILFDRKQPWDRKADSLKKKR